MGLLLLSRRSWRIDDLGALQEHSRSRVRQRDERLDIEREDGVARVAGSPFLSTDKPLVERKQDGLDQVWAVCECEKGLECARAMVSRLVEAPADFGVRQGAQGGQDAFEVFELERLERDVDRNCAVDVGGERGRRVVMVEFDRVDTHWAIRAGLADILDTALQIHPGEDLLNIANPAEPS